MPESRRLVVMQTHLCVVFCSRTATDKRSHAWIRIRHSIHRVLPCNRMHADSTEPQRPCWRMLQIHHTAGNQALTSVNQRLPMRRPGAFPPECPGARAWPGAKSDAFWMRMQAAALPSAQPRQRMSPPSPRRRRHAPDGGALSDGTGRLSADGRCAPCAARAFRPPGPQPLLRAASGSSAPLRAD